MLVWVPKMLLKTKGSRQRFPEPEKQAFAEDATMYKEMSQKSGFGKQKSVEKQGSFGPSLVARSFLA